MGDCKWTKGPWRIIDTISSCAVYAGVRQVLRYAFGPDAENRANAHLIAASPDLYEVLNCIDFDDGMIAEALGEDLQDKIHAAMAKARGE